MNEQYSLSNGEPPLYQLVAAMAVIKNIKIQVRYVGVTVALFKI